MTKISGPLHSQAASGNMGKGIMQFRTVNGFTHAYKPVLPALQNQRIPTAAQLAQRLQFTAARDSWQSLEPEAKQAWNIGAAIIGKMNGWNYYLSVYLAKSIYPDDTLLCLDDLPIMDEYGVIIRTD